MFLVTSKKTNNEKDEENPFERCIFVVFVYKSTLNTSHFKVTAVHINGE